MQGSCQRSSAVCRLRISKMLEFRCQNRSSHCSKLAGSQATGWNQRVNQDLCLLETCLQDKVRGQQTHPYQSSQLLKLVKAGWTKRKCSHSLKLQELLLSTNLIHFLRMRWRSSHGTKWCHPRNQWIDLFWSPAMIVISRIWKLMLKTIWSDLWKIGIGPECRLDLP